MVDQIRNPLSIIAGLVEITDCNNANDSKWRILESVKRIEDIVSRLDEGWLESEEIRDFLKNIKTLKGE